MNINWKVLYDFSSVNINWKGPSGFSSVNINLNFPYFFFFNEYKISCTVPKEIDFPWYNIKCRGENVILHGIFNVVSGFPLHFMLYRGNLDCFSNSVGCSVIPQQVSLTDYNMLWWVNLTGCKTPVSQSSWCILFRGSLDTWISVG